MHFFKYLKVIICSFLLIELFSVETKGVWSDDVDAFVANRLRPLRDSRSQVKRPNFSFKTALDIFDFIENGKAVSGVNIVAQSKEFSDLIIDICDIVNLSHPYFKNRYDVFIEQWENNNQLPFSLFTFDRIAQVFHYSDDLFDKRPGSQYNQILERILVNELTPLRNAFSLICDLDEVKRNPVSSIIEGNHGKSRHDLIALNVHLDQIDLKPGLEKAKEQKDVRRKAPPPRLKGLFSLSAMAHDYLTLGRIEEASDLALSIPAFTIKEQREAFLASMIQVGELATNKNLSSFIRIQMPTIPWGELVHCRDAIEHQDEHGFSVYFHSILDESNNVVDFTAWQNDLKSLLKRVKETKRNIWGNQLKDRFEEWLNGEITNNPTYGVTRRVAISSMADSKIFRKGFLLEIDGRLRNCFALKDKKNEGSVLKDKKNEWADLIQGKSLAKIENLGVLLSAITRLETSILTLVDGSQEKKREENYLKAHREVEIYLWQQLKNQATHLNDDEKNLLVQTIKDELTCNEITYLCINLLKNDPLSLTNHAARNFLQTAVSKNLPTRLPILQLFQRFRPEMPITRKVCMDLPWDSTKDLPQTDRKKFGDDMFKRTTEHLHTLAHTDDLCKRLYDQTIANLYEYMFQEGLKSKDRQRRRKFEKLEKKREQIYKQHGFVDKYGFSDFTQEGSRLWAKAFKNKGIKVDFMKIVEDSKTNGFDIFQQKVVQKLYQSAHKLYLKDAILKNPTTYLGSVKENYLNQISMATTFRKAI